MFDELSLGFFLATGVVVLLTGIAKSGFAGGLGILAVPVMSAFIDPVRAAAIMLPILCALDAVNVWAYRSRWDSGVLRALLPAAILGIAAGAALASLAPAAAIRALIGLYATGVALRNLSGWGRVRVPRNGAIPAFLSGFASFVAHAGGPPIKAYLMARLPEKTAFVATNTAFFAAINALKLPPYILVGGLTLDAALVALAFLPVVPLGIWLGIRLHHIMRPAAFSLAVNLALLASGINLLGSVFF